MMQKTLTFFILIVALGTVTLCRDVALAQSSASVLKLEPVLNEMTAKPGDRVVRQITLTNLSNIPLPIKGYARQFSATDELGDSDFPDNPDQKSVQQWFSFDTADFILQGHDSRTIILTIQIPNDAEPGGHYATVFFQSLIPKEILSQTTISLASRIGALFFLVVAGDVHTRGTLAEFSTAKVHQQTPVELAIRFTNTGNVHVRPASTITITNWRGSTVAVIDDDGQIVLPNKTRRWNVVWSPVGWAFGQYRASIVTTIDAGAKSEQSSITFWVMPFFLIGKAILSLVLVFWLLTRGRRRLAKAYQALRGKL